MNYGAISDAPNEHDEKTPLHGRVGPDDGTHASDDSLGMIHADHSMDEDDDEHAHILSAVRHNSHRTLIVAGTASIPSEVANMTKNLIGGGVLSLR